jgi:actin related protein 2/3 complex subunit 5
MSLLDIINSTKSSDIPVIVKSLSLDEQDRLMKYIYKGLASPELGASAVLLGWHEKVRAANILSCRSRS